ncbi:PPOX class F420-dependent oxidoreductase [Amnibacterium sp. CER49]|uniref:PPOX class F420-dependent oxidoreductase n=1 Tax=Amnibacterium sp. CER49 TaxID=3039161 RepID=UPI00244C6D87|nr:PPOX class F420-dependent oxidoreductase [Amnibacterium sp. CER49]MDH2442754.1 PPOX class F420-dependent oxidoreductase [Amnibacterium sp. CER49]
MPLPDDLVALLKRRAVCYLATTMPDGSPQVTLTWADTDGEHILINTVRGHQKTRNVERDPRVAVALSDPDDPTRFRQVRGRVVALRTDGAEEHIEALAQRYTGGPYRWWGGRDQERVILAIEPRRMSGTG